MTNRAAASASPEPTSLAAKLLNIFVSPSDVFDEVIATPLRSTNWIVPTFLVALASLFLLSVGTTQEQTSAAVQHLIEAGRISANDANAINSHWFLISIIGVCGAALIGTLWSALIIWGVARIFLKVVVSFQKVLEVVGLAGMVLVLGAIITALLIIATGNPSARPALSFLANPQSPARATLDVFNLFYFWSTAVLAIGLSRLGGVSVKEASFWVFGYWLVLRVSLMLLS
jgi:hypothetical protein